MISKSNGKWVFCKHKERKTYEIPGGHRESHETIVETARRELSEETGAVQFDITPVCVYSVTGRNRVNQTGEETYGMLFFANIQSDIFIPKSDIIHHLKSNIEGIDSVDLYIISQKNEEAIYKQRYEDEYYVMNNLTGQYVKKVEKVKLHKGENPNLGLDNHGNIYLKTDSQFPVLMGGWEYVNNEDELVTVTDALTVVFEE